MKRSTGLRALLSEGESEIEAKEEAPKQPTKQFIVDEHKALALAKKFLRDEHKALALEVAHLELRRSKRWQELIEEGMWDQHEEDPEVLFLDKRIEEKSARQVYLRSRIHNNDHLKPITERVVDEEERNFNKNNGQDSTSSSSTVSSKSEEGSSCVVQEERKLEELDYLFLVKVKRGEKKMYVNFLLNEDHAGYEGPFDLDTPVSKLIRHNNVVHPNEDRWKVSKENEIYKATKRTMRPLLSFSEGFMKDKIPNVGFAELLESERRGKRRRSENFERPVVNNGMIPRFEVGDKVYYFVREIGNEKWHSCTVLGMAYPGEENNSIESEEVLYKLLPDKEEGQTYEIVERKENELRSWSWASRVLVANYNSKPAPLVPLDLVGIDTCSALSVSSVREDFLWIDESTEAKRSVILRGVGGESAAIGGRGPMAVTSKDSDGNEVVIFDTSAVYLKENREQAGLRIFGQQRLKRFGFNLQQRSESDGGDILCYNHGQMNVPLITTSGILTLKTHPRSLTDSQLKFVETMVDSALEGKDGCDYCIQITSSLIMNEANLSKIEAERLQHWRIGHRSIKNSNLNEDCPACTEGKKKTGTFKRNVEFLGSTKGRIRPYWRLFGDGYGGQRSMGVMSYQGGIGGYVFACPTGAIKTKLYGSTEQFPAILFQVLQEIESEGYVTRELYVDTHSVNLSKAAEEVAAMYRVRIIPVSAGTPQEMAYAESAVRVIGQMGRTLMCGAPHLPRFCWGLADLYATYIHELLPQAKHGCSPYEYRTGRRPDLDHFFVKVFGAPCQYAPMGGAEHKRSRKTEWGWFVGMQLPMCLVLRPEDNKILSVSRKKMLVHEECYARYDPTMGTNPLANFSFETPVINIDAVKTQTENLQTIKDYKKLMQIPDHVLSVKGLSDYARHPELNEPTPDTRPPPEMLQHLTPPQDSGGETMPHVPEHKTWSKNLMQEKIRELRKQINARFDKDGKVEAIVKALKKAEEEASNEAPQRGNLKKRIVKFKSKSMGKKGYTINEMKPVLDEKGKESAKTKQVKRKIDIGDRVKIKTRKFGIAYAKGLPTFTYGSVRGKKGDLFDVLWDEGDEMTAHKRHLSLQESEDEHEGDDPRLDSKVSMETLLPILSVGASLSQPSSSGKDSWPKDFYEALLRDDWRDWVQAVKNENESWSMFDASTEIPYDQMEKGASIIPLGELFSVKRSGKYKFRQYALGNLLKEGKDFGETFSSTVSGDGLRWFCALACSCRKQIRGWDATTGYLQTQQRVKVYAYLPSHHGFSDLSFEALAPFRFRLKTMENEGGIKAVKEFARKMKRERRDKPKTVLQLNKSVYGIPDAGQSFSMFMQGLHIKHCSMVQSEMDPCVYYRIMEDEKGVVTAYLLVISWVDDCRYFGTDDLVTQYEKDVMSHCKCTLDGEAKEFVSIQINHQIEKGILELTQEEYWEKAVARFKEFLPADGPKERKVPLSPADEKLLVEPTDQEIKAAEHLPYPSLLGVCQYPSAYTRLEMRFAMSVLSRHRTKWSLNHFKILIKALEYGYLTRKMGLRYDANLTEEELNTLVGYADSSFSVPRSQGCRTVLMNGAAISLTSKRHTTTDDSTTAAELTECHLCACDIVGFRELNSEIGLKQSSPTVIYQDNQSAIKIAMNRGSLAKKTRAMEIRVFSIRNKIEDMKVVPIYLETTKMLADLGTKALDPKQFCALRDVLCGYAHKRILGQG
jgi:hypothetical protein